MTVPNPFLPPPSGGFGKPSPIAADISLKFLQRDAPELAKRIVAEIDSPEQLAADMGLTALQWQILQHHAYFKELMVQARTEANSPAGLQDKARLQALAALTNGNILDMAQIAGNPHASAAARINATSVLVDISGISKQKDQQASQVGAGPMVVINIPGATAAPVEIGGRVIEHD